MEREIFDLDLKVSEVSPQISHPEQELPSSKDANANLSFKPPCPIRP